MKLVHPNIDTQFVIEQGKCWELVVEPHHLYVTLIREFAQQMSGYEGEWVFSIDNKPKALTKHINLIIDPFNLDPRKSRPLLKRINDRLSTAAKREEFHASGLEVLSSMQRFVNDLIDEAGFSFEVTVNDSFALDSLIGSLGAAPIFDVNNVKEMLLEYCLIMSELAGVALFVIIGLRSWVNINELQQLINECQQSGLSLMMIENYADSHLDGVRRCIIDESLAEI